MIEVKNFLFTNITDNNRIKIYTYIVQNIHNNVVREGVRLSNLFALSSRSELFLGAVASSFRVPGSHSILRQQDERMLRIPTVAAFQSYSTANAVVCPHFDSIFLHLFQISNKL